MPLRFKRVSLASTFCLALVTFGCGGDDAGTLSANDTLAEADSPLFVKHQGWGSLNLHPCWVDGGFETEKEWVREALRTTWEKDTGVKFTGWGGCTDHGFPGPPEIRIAIRDVQPHTHGLGSELAFDDDGMVLNFTFNNWETSCRDPARKRYCIQSIAVHEFGHALAFAHEQNRGDRPAWCDQRQGSYGDSTVGEWDLNSVMNYCNPRWNNDGRLSATDVDGSRKSYGRPVLHVAGVDDIGRLWHRLGVPPAGWKDQFGNVETEAGEMGTAVDVAMTQANRELHLMATNTAGEIKHTFRREDGSWAPFTTFASGSFTRLGIAAAVELGHVSVRDEIHVCAIKADGTLWHGVRRQDGSSTGFFNVSTVLGWHPGPFADLDCAHVNEDLEVAAVTRTGQLFHARRARSGAWPFTWKSVFGEMFPRPVDPGPIRDVALTDWGQYLHVLVTNTSGQRFVARRHPSDPIRPWGPYAAVPTTGSGSFQTVASARYRNTIVAAGNDAVGRVRHAAWRQNGDTWVWDSRYSALGDGKLDPTLTRISIASGGTREFEDLNRANLPATIYDSGSIEQTFLLGDFNGDGRSDVFQTFRGWGSIPTCTSTGSAWSCDNLPALIIDSGSNHQQFLTGDFNGDGRTDVIQTFRGWHSIPTCRSTGTAWDCQDLSADIYDSGSVEQRFLTGDFNGDGRTDVFQTYRNWDSIPTCTSTGTGFSCQNLPATIDHAGGPLDQFLVGDYNGDGRADIAQVSMKRNGSIPVCLSTGSGWSCSNPPATVYDSGRLGQQALVGDVNGDGRADIVQASELWDSFPVCFSTGNGWNCDNRPAQVHRLPVEEGIAFQLADMNSDARSDVVQSHRSWGNFSVCFAGDSTWNCDSFSTDTYNAGDFEQRTLIGQFDGGRRDLFRVHRRWGSIPTDRSTLR